MKPRTKRQVLVANLSNELPDLRSKLQPWAFKNCINHIGYRNKMWTSCLCCGYVWPTTSMRIKNEVCEGCGWKLKLETTRKQKSREWARFAVLDVKGDFQVVRYFDINCHMKSPNGEFEIFSSVCGGMGLSYEHFGGTMSIKNKKDIWKYNIPVYKIHPESKIQPVYKRNGFVLSLTEIRPFDLLKNLSTDPKTETLLKAKQFSLLRAHLGDRRSGTWRHWNSVKICIRSGYIVKDAITWLDYLDLLSWLGKDLRNSKFVCPKDLKKEHDRYVKKRNEITKRQDLARRMKQAEADQIEYIRSKSAFFGISFTDKDLEIKVLESIQEFIEESNTHKHCVYSNRYFAKEDSLVLSARVNGKSVETVELSISKLQIVQSRGLQNNTTEYHDRIIALVNSNIHVIHKKSKKTEGVSV
jgi:hypothetical protein